MKHQLTITIIGSGNVATHFGKAFLASGAKIKEVCSRNPVHAKKLAGILKAKAVSDLSKIGEGSDLYLIAVNDDSIAQVAEKLNVKNGIVVHTGGSIPMELLSKFPQHGIFYPLQTLSKNTEISFEGLPVCIEASDKNTFAFLESAGKCIGAAVYKLNSKQRAAAHLAAVFACNFTNHLYSISENLLKKEKLPFDLLRPLIAETAKKVQTVSPAEAQTGPALRNDKAVMKKHLSALKKEKDLQKLYKKLSEGIRKK